MIDITAKVANFVLYKIFSILMENSLHS